MTGINFFDAGIMAFVQDHFHTPLTDFLFPIFTFLGEMGIFWIILGICLLFFRKTRRCGCCLLGAMLFGFLAGELTLKNIVCRPRPFQMFPEEAALIISPPSGFSFPSGHTCSSFAAASVIFAHFKKWGVPALALACLIGFSRIFLFVHWPSDVLSGAVLGILSALLSLFLCRLILMRTGHGAKEESPGEDR